MFSKRTEWCLTPNALALRLQSLRESGVDVLDLTESNPTRCRFRYGDGLLSVLADSKSLRYEPSPKGLPAARKSVASIYSSKNLIVNPDQIFLTASTSEAYSYLFRLLTDPGDQVLVPQPSYPLFQYLANLNDVKPVPYFLRYRKNGWSVGQDHSSHSYRWRVDLGKLSRSVTGKTRALILVHPNNPTGSCVDDEELARILSVCRKHSIALIADEVFSEYLYPLNPAAVRKIPLTLSGDPDVLTFSLGGLSKFMGLPQMKLAWVVATGPSDLVRRALERMELIADTYLSVNTPVQEAFPRWLEQGSDIQSQIRERVQANRRFLMELCRHEKTKGTMSSGSRMEVLAADGGWSAVFRIRSVEDEEKWVLGLLDQKHVLVHPGYFFDCEEPGMIVVSLLPPIDIFQEGIRCLLNIVP